MISTTTKSKNQMYKFTTLVKSGIKSGIKSGNQMYKNTTHTLLTINSITK